MTHSSDGPLGISLRQDDVFDGVEDGRVVVDVFQVDRHRHWGRRFPRLVVALEFPRKNLKIRFGTGLESGVEP